MSDDFRIVMRRTGGTDVLERETIAPSSPGPGEVRLRHEAIGLNFIDTYHRTGVYALPLPSGLGSEAAGRIEAVGPDVTGFVVGDRVAYAGGPVGAYATVRAMPAGLLTRLPDAIDARTAAAVMLKGLTADMLVGACGRVAPGQAVLVHAAAGGVGSLLVQWLKAVGAIVIAHAGSPAKAERARLLGADHALYCPFADLAEKVRGLTGGRGADIVLDSVGRDSWAGSLGAVARRGLIVSYGNASGPVAPVPPLDLMRAGSVYLVRPTLADFGDPLERETAAGRLFAMLASGRVAVEIGAEWPLAEAAQAHEALEGRRTTGSTILIP